MYNLDYFAASDFWFDICTSKLRHSQVSYLRVEV